MLDAQTRPQSAALSPAEQDNALHLIPPRSHGGAFGFSGGADNLVKKLD